MNIKLFRQISFDHLIFLYISVLALLQAHAFWMELIYFSENLFENMLKDLG
jgi:hypothetical protein